MKILKYLLYAIVGLVIIFLGIGLLNPSINYGHEITVNKSVKEAWAVHQDQSKLGQWLEGFKSIDLVEGEAGAVGSKYKVVVKPSEEEDDFEMIETIVAKEEFKNIELTFDSDMMLFDQTTTFSESDGSTTIKTDSKVSGKGIFMRSLFGTMEMFTGSFQTQEEKHLEGLKKVIEENTTDYYPAPIVSEEETENSSEEVAE